MFSISTKQKFSTIGRERTSASIIATLTDGLTSRTSGTTTQSGKSEPILRFLKGGKSEIHLKFIDRKYGGVGYLTRNGIPPFNTQKFCLYLEEPDTFASPEEVMARAKELLDGDYGFRDDMKLTDFEAEELRAVYIKHFDKTFYFDIHQQLDAWDALDTK